MERKGFVLLACAISVLLFVFSFAGSIQAQCASDADCEDGLFCTRDTCDLSTGNCAVITACPPSIDGCVTRSNSCDEDNDVCVDFADDSLCDVGEICDLASGECLGVTCGMAQLTAQEAVMSGFPYKNHGQMVRTAAQSINEYLYEGMISEECHSCIVSQFARGIPCVEQEPCDFSISECPETLVPSYHSYWYEMYPDFSGVSEINLRVVLNNASPETLEFDDDTFQLWSVPSVIETMPVTINEEPVDPVAPGETLTYDLTIDVSGLPVTEYTLAFRAVSVTLGTMATETVPLHEVMITCE